MAETSADSSALRSWQRPLVSRRSRHRRRRGRGRGGPAGPVVVSPLVNPDRSVTLRLLAPKATEAIVTGELATAARRR